MGKLSNRKNAKNKEFLVICGSDKPHAKAQRIYRNKANHKYL